MAGVGEPTSLSTTSTPRESRPTLLSYDEIPEWYQDNAFIRHGYRPESNSAHACFTSWLYLHNESVNIHTHLLPAIIFLLVEGLLAGYFHVCYPTSSAGDRLVFAFYLSTATACLGMSATFHTLLNHSIGVSNLWLRLDFVGIIVLTIGKFVSGIYMIFYCKPMLRWIYWTMILTLGLITIIILVNPRFQGPRWRTFRVCTFIGTGLTGVAPIAHGIQLFGWSQMVKHSGIVYYLAEGALLILGTLFYSMRIPESIKPGQFDIFGSSHQIFHLLVLSAAVVHLVGILSAFHYNYKHQTCGVA